MKFDHENPNDKIFSDISLTIMLDIHLAVLAHHQQANLLAIGEHPFKYTLL